MLVTRYLVICSRSSIPGELILDQKTIMGRDVTKMDGGHNVQLPKIIINSSS